MSPNSRIPFERRRTILLLLFAMAPFSLGVAVPAQKNGSEPNQLVEAYTLHIAGDSEEGIQVANELLRQTDLSPRDSVAIFECLSVITFGLGPDYSDQSYGYLRMIADIGPCLKHLPESFWPSGHCDRWYEILQARNALSCPPDTSPDIRTIAIMPFDNFSTGEYQKKLGVLQLGITDLVKEYFSSFGDLRVVERSKIAYIVKEYNLIKDGVIDRASAVRLGKALGAHLMVFGSISQIGESSSRMSMRVIKVETTEQITAKSKEGKPEFYKMGKELVKELAEALDLRLSKDAKERLERGGTKSMGAMQHYALGLDSEDRYDYKSAYEEFKKAYELDNDFAQAKLKMDVYRPLAG